MKNTNTSVCTDKYLSRLILKTVSNTFKVHEMKNVFKDALTTKEQGPKVIIAQSECTLNKTRRERPAMAKRI